MMKTSLICVLLTIGVALATHKVRYDGFKVYKVVPQSSMQIEALKYLEEHNTGFIFWSGISQIGKPIHIMVPPHLELVFADFIKLQSLSSEIYIENVQEKIDNERPKMRSVKFGWGDYYRLDDIYQWLQELSEEYPDVVTLVQGGSSYEGRKIMGVKVSYSPNNANRGVFLEGGIHAREWIAPATVTYMLNQLLTSSDPKVREIAENNDWYIFPVVNPDGYEYTHTGDRIWRKTRKPYGICYGADPNRNWGYHWMDGGASSNPCSETHAGSEAFSETETKTLSEYITSISDKLYSYIGFHSFSQLLLIPYGHSNAHVENYEELMRIGNLAKKSLAQRYGTQYTVGNIVDVIYVASGGSMDWVKGIYHTPITYTFELRDTGRNGFLLPASEIIPTGEETLDALVTIVQEATKSQKL